MMRAGRAARGSTISRAEEMVSEGECRKQRDAAERLRIYVASALASKHDG
jgi:hypothetical protein